MKPATIQEYQRRAALWNEFNGRARELVKEILGEAEYAEIDALATAHHRGFFAQFLQWTIDPLNEVEPR